MKIVKKATVEPVSFSNLNVGDSILYSNLVLEITDKNDFVGHTIRARSMDGQIVDDLGFRRYYRIKGKPIVVEVCEYCEKEFVGPMHGNCCEKCFVSGLMGSYENPKTGKKWTDDQIAEEFKKQRMYR